jgi:hypothetical protein
MSFWSTDLMVRMPFFGLIARNRKNIEKGSKGWMMAEEKLCSVYKKYISQLPEDKFLQRIEYMKHSGDLGRTPMTIGLKLFLFILVAAEAMGFSYILGTWAATEGSANLYETLMYAIVFVLASILAIVTHKAGEQFYRTTLIRSCFKVYKDNEDKEYSTRVIALTDDQMADSKEPSHIRCLNRIIENPRDLGSYGWVWTAGVFVAFIFVGSGVMRYQHMEAELIRQTQASDTTTSNPFAAGAALPAAVVAPQQAVDKQAKDEQRSSTKIEGGAAIMILGLIFVVTQIVGFGAGYKHSFAGKETYKTTKGSNAFWWWSEHDGAYADTWGYSTYHTYWEAMQPVKDLVNARLKELQHLLKQSSHKNLELTNTFDDYLHDMAERSRPGARSKPRVESEPSPIEAKIVEQPAVLPLDKAKADIDALTDKAKQQEYFSSLPIEVRDALKPWLKQRKEQAVAAASKAELEDLF